MNTRIRYDIIWIDDTHIRLLVDGRDAWRGDWCVIDLLKQLDNLDYIDLWEHENIEEYDRSVSTAKA
jgi:hypothetical protein